MDVRAWFRPPRQVLTIFLTMGVVSAAALGALTWRLLTDQRDLEAKHQADRLQDAADQAAAGMQLALTNLRARFGASTPAVDPASSRDVLAVALSPEGVTVRPPGYLLFYPAFAGPAEAADVFAEGERLESGTRDLAEAAAVYTRLSASTNPNTRAGALLRLARVQHRLGANERALTAYAELFALTSASAGGWPAPLAARLGRMAVLRSQGRAADLTAEASSLLADLQHGRWSVTKPAYEAFSAEARSVLSRAAPDDVNAVQLAEAVWWLSKNRDAMNGAGQRIISSSAGPVLALWTARPSTLDVVIAGTTYIDDLCKTVFDKRTGWLLSDLNGGPILGASPPAGTVVFVPAAGVDLPWNLRVYGLAGGAPPSPQRKQLLLVLGLVAVALACGWYVIFRSLTREQRVAQLQSDFVSAVSHEFRSPLTSIAHVADLLYEDRLTSDDLRRESYGVLRRETARLRTLVEGLLDFGRFDNGKSGLRFETLDLVGLVANTVAEFRRQVASSGHEIQLAGGQDPVAVRGDREALERAVWNLLDNAVKYSPDSHSVHVEVQAAAADVTIAVRDWGFGIPPAEQRAIFDRFVRGAESKRRRIRGTGIGLAMVRQIVQGHGGHVSVKSALGAGSTFTITLPGKNHG